MFVGIDTQKDTLAVPVVDASGAQLACAEFDNARQRFVRIAGMLARHCIVRVGIEGSGN